MIDFLLNMIGPVVTLILGTYLGVSISSFSTTKEKKEYLNRLLMKLFMGSIIAFQLFVTIYYGNEFLLEMENMEGTITRPEVLKLVLLSFATSFNLIFIVFQVSIFGLLRLLESQMEHVAITKMGLLANVSESKSLDQQDKLTK